MKKLLILFTFIIFFNLPLVLAITSRAYGDWILLSEGDRIKIGDAWMNQNVSFTKDNSYTNTWTNSLEINTTASLPSCYVQSSVNITNSTGHNQTIWGYGSDYVYFNATIPTSGKTYTINFKTPILNITRNETEITVSWWKYFNINGTCIDISNVKANASIPEDRTAFTISDNTTGAMTDVTGVATYNVIFRDTDGDGYSDLISWTIPTLSANTESKFVIEGKGVTCSMSSREITNAPLRTMETLAWRETISCSNSANSSVAYSQKWRMLLGVRDVELDNIAKNLLYDEYGAYVMLTGSLSGGESETRYLDYKSDPITAEARYYYPVDRGEDYYVNEDAYLTINVTAHNWAPFDVDETIEIEIPIIYLEDLKVNYNGSEIDSENEVLGKYVLEIDSINASSEKEYELNGTFPTAISERILNRPVPPYGLILDVYRVTSVSMYTLPGLILEVPINFTLVNNTENYDTKEQFEFSQGSTKINLGTLDIGITKNVAVYYYPETPIERPDMKEIWEWLNTEVFTLFGTIFTRLYLILISLSGVGIVILIVFILKRKGKIKFPNFKFWEKRKKELTLED